jgi:hypothetical protein
MMKPIAISLVAAGALACTTAPTFRGIDVSSGQTIELKPFTHRQGTLPKGVPISPDRQPTFDGTYLSPQFGIVNLTRQPNAKIEGDFKYKSCGCEVKGMIHGKVVDNLMSFEWTEDAPSCLDGWHARGNGHLFLSTQPRSDGLPRLFGHHAYSVDVSDERHATYHTEVRDAGVLTAVRVTPGDIDQAESARCP